MNGPSTSSYGFASVVAPEDGTYVLLVRESAYAGNANCRYGLHVGNLPRPTATVPAVGKFGQDVSVRWTGDPLASRLESARKLADAARVEADKAVRAFATLREGHSYRAPAETAEVDRLSDDRATADKAIAATRASAAAVAAANAARAEADALAVEEQQLEAARPGQSVAVSSAKGS